jgi:hypothetical protein
MIPMRENELTATTGLIPTDRGRTQPVALRSLVTDKTGRWRLIFAVLLVAGFILAASGYRHGLPYLDFPDEVTIWTMGRAYVDPSWPMFQPEYPPGLLIVSSTIQRLQTALGDPYLNPAGTIEAMRFLSVLAFTVTLALVMFLAYRFAGPLAGTIAGLCWLLLPLANHQAKVATIDAWLCMWFIASIAAGVEGYRRQSMRWMALSLALAIVATLFKYQGAAALGMAGLASLSLWKSDRRRMLAVIAAYLLIVAAFSYWVVFIHRALEGGLYLPGSTTSRPSVDTIAINVLYQLTDIGPVLIFGVLAMFGLFLSFALPSARRRLHGQMALFALPVIIVVFDTILSFNGARLFNRQYLAAMTLLAILAGIAVALLWQIADAAARRVGQPGVTFVTKALLIGLIGVPLASMASESRAIALDLSRPDRRALFAEWARTTATDGPMLITDPTTAAAVQTLYGYRGRPIETPYNEGTSVHPSESDVTQALVDAKNIRYIVASPHFKGEGLTAPLTRLIAFDTDDNLRGSEWAAYYVGALPTLPPEQWIAFGNQIQVRGFSISTQAACPGAPLEAQLLWGAVKRPASYYAMYFHLFSEKTGEIGTEVNGRQPISEERPTISWTVPNELLVGPRTRWSLPPDLPPGDYQLWLGVYEPTGGTRLTLPDGNDHYVLAKVSISPCP